MSGPAPLVLRVLLRCLPLGDRRDEITSDLAELFDVRRRTRGRIHAYGRLIQDIGSLVTHANAAGRSSLSGSQHPSTRSTLSAGLTSWLLDLRYGLRLLRKHPAVIGATVGGLALAIAVSTSVFTILNAGVIRPYGMDDPKSVVRVQMLLNGGLSTNWPFHAFAAMRDRAQQSQLVASMDEQVRASLLPGDSAAPVDRVLLVSGGYLPTLGGRAVLGRALLPSDDEPGAVPVAVVHARYWTTRLNADRSIVGKTIWLSGRPVTVVGVIASSFTGPVDNPPAFWVPMGTYGAVFGDRPIDRTSAVLVDIVSRVANGATRAAAESELSAIVTSLPDVGIRGESGVTSPATGVRFDGASSPMDGPDSIAMLAVVGVIMLVVGLVLALACANVANLLLAGAASRAREIGVRLALGASRRRILRQLLSESVMIGLMAGTAGLVLSLWIVPIVATMIGLPDTHDLRPDFRVMLFTAAVAALCGAAAGLAPARHGSRSDVMGVLKSQGANASAPPKATRTRRLFIGFQACASILLLVTAALFLRGAMHIARVDVGFDAKRLITVVPSFPRSDFNAAAAAAFWRTAVERVRAIPSVEQASLSLTPPFAGAVTIREVPAMRRAGATYRIYQNGVDAAYFGATGLRLARGRPFTADEVRANAPVAVVSESIVRDFFNDTEPIGARLTAVSKDLSSITIIGVAGEAMTGRLRGLGNGTIYQPLQSSEVKDARLVVRSARPEAIVSEVEQVLVGVDARVRPSTILMSQDVDRAMTEPRILAGLAATVAGLALVLAVLGVYGVTTFVVGQRMWEMQVRQAIGASAGNIVRLLIRQSLTPVLIGLTVGLAIALAAVRILTPALSGVSPYDPAAIAGAVLVLLVATIAAVLSPALRAGRADPAAVLRQP